MTTDTPPKPPQDDTDLIDDVTDKIIAFMFSNPDGTPKGKGSPSGLFVGPGTEDAIYMLACSIVERVAKAAREAERHEVAALAAARRDGP